MPSTRSTLPALTGLRAVLALHVLAFHAFFTFGRTNLLLPRGAARNIVASGYLGVNAFFVLSGFVLAYSQLGDDGSLATPAKRFYRARFARIVPMHLVGVLLALPLFVLQSLDGRAAVAAIAREGGIELAVCAAMLQAWIPRFVFALDGPEWSLGVEALFYLSFPLLARVLARAPRWRLVLVLVAAYGIALAPALVHGVDAPPVERAAAIDLVIRFDPLVRLPELVLGFALGRIFVRSPTGSRAWELGFLASLLGIVVVLARADALPEPLLHAGLLDPLWASLFVCAARSRLAETTLAAPLFEKLGRSSFSLYVVHKPLWFWMDRLLPRPIPRFSFTFVGVYAAVALVLAATSFRLVEEPLRRRLTRGARTGKR